MVNLKLGNLDNAKADIAKAEQLDFDNPYVFKHRALIHLVENNKEVACIDFNIAIEKGYRTFGDEADAKEIDQLLEMFCK